jgi:RNA polymerase sigma-70 factor (ECF subfamily)
MNQLIMQGLEGKLQTERSRIVGLCVTLTGNVDIAEDLAQETMLEAWRSLERLQDSTLFTPWLSGIARNVCLRWQRKQGHPLATPQQLPQEQLIDDFDLEVELEHKELIELLDRALATLPPETREVLIARYIEESPLSELAQRLGMQTNTIAMRLQRGKLALRRVLTSELASEALEYGFSSNDEWEETSIWCTICGQHRLLGQFRSDEAKLFLSCPQCGEYNHTNLANTSEAALFRGIKRVKPALTRLHGWVQRYYHAHPDAHEAPCLRCGHPVPLRILHSLNEINTSEIFGRGWRDDHGVYQFCQTCDMHNLTSLDGLSLALPEGQRFMHEHTRIRKLPEQEIEVDGLAAVVKRFESITDQALYEVVSARDTFQMLQVNGRHL